MSVFEKVQSNIPSLVADRRRARNEGVDHVIELSRSARRGELQWGFESGLRDGEAIETRRRGGPSSGSHLEMKVEDGRIGVAMRVGG